MANIKDIQCFLLDMDGTIYLGEELIDGAFDFIQLLKEQDKSFVFLTNNSSKNSLNYKEKLERLGIEVSQDLIFTSGTATKLYLLNKNKNSKIFLLGTRELETEFEEAGFQLVRDGDADIDYVVLGFDTTLTYDKMWKACDYIRKGIPYIATHPDFNCPLAHGKMMPDIGAMINFIEGATNKRPYIIGKPNKEIIDVMQKKYGFDRDEVAMVGDRLYTDIQTGINANISTVLVLSGETKIEDYNDSNISAEYIYESIKELKKAIE